jgi:electron transport complex protein RnfD
MATEQTTPRIELRTAPHVKAPHTVEQIMRNVVYALLPVCAFFVFQYGLSAAALIVTVTATCIATERLFNRLAGQASTLADFSATITGLLLALTLPPGFPLWMAVVAGFTAIGLGKALFGGIGFNVFNPALVGRAFVQAAFPVAISTWSPSFMPERFVEFIPTTLTLPLMTPGDVWEWVRAHHLDATVTATPLSRWKFEGVEAAPLDMMLSLATTAAVGPSPIVVLACGLYLAARRMLDWRIPVAVLLSALIVALILRAVDPGHYPSPMFVLMSGGLIIGALFMATDMATSPVTPLGVWIYGALIGVLTVMIRYYGGLPEGVMYAILIANAASPLIEHYTPPRTYGHRPRWRQMLWGQKK